MSSYLDDTPMLPPIYTYEIPVFTGVLDSTGSPIFRHNNPIGFGRDNEWHKPMVVTKGY